MSPRMGFELEFRSLPLAKGSLRHALLPWDTELYGFPFVELDIGNAGDDELEDGLRRFLADVAPRPTCLVSTRLRTDAVATSAILARSGFYCAETSVVLGLRLAALRQFEGPGREGYVLRPAEPGDLPMLLDFGTSFETDRFHLDPNLRGPEADLRYQRWITRSLEDPGDAVWVLADRSNGSVDAWVIFRAQPDGLVNVNLGGVSAHTRSRGVSKLTIGDVLALYRGRGFERATIQVSLNNLPIMKSVGGLGFRFESAVHVYHWFRGDGRTPK